jgi:hypothetical protein
MTSTTQDSRQAFWSKVRNALFPKVYEQPEEPDEPYIISRVLHFRSRYISLSQLRSGTREKENS